LDKKYAIFENYTQCIPLALSRRCSSNACGKRECAALLAEGERASGESALPSERFTSQAVTLAAAFVGFNSNFDFAAFRRVRKNLKAIRVTKDKPKLKIQHTPSQLWSPIESVSFRKIVVKSEIRAKTPNAWPAIKSAIQNQR